MNIDDEDFQGRVEELAEQWQEDPQKLKEAWGRICGDPGDYQDQLAESMIGEPDTLYARALRFHNVISQAIFTELCTMAEEHLEQAKETAKYDEGEDRAWAAEDKAAGLDDVRFD